MRTTSAAAGTKTAAKPRLGGAALRKTRAYLDRFFISRAELLARAGISGGFLSRLVAAGAAPGPIYKAWPNGAMSSATASKPCARASRSRKIPR